MKPAPALSVQREDERAPAPTRTQRVPHGSSSRDALALSVLRFAFLVAALVGASWTTADPDLWGHVRFGRDIVETGGLEATDHYSFTSDRSWVNHEWLAEVAFALALGAGGPIGLVALKMLVLVGVIACISVRFRQFSWSPVPHDLLIGLVLLGTLPRYHPIRPQLFSLLLFAAMLLALVMFDRGRRRALIAVPVIFAMWANLHGGFLVGLGVLAGWLGVRLLQAPRLWLTFVATGLAALAATLLTPYGVGLWQFLWETVGFGRPVIQDWQPVWAAGGQVKLGWSLVTLTAAAALWRARGRVDPAALVISVLLGVAALRVSRIDAFYTIAVVMLLGPVFVRRSAPLPAPAMRPWAWGAGAAVVAIGLIASEGRASCIQLLDYPEPEATAFLGTRDGRVLTFFDWGQYAIWHLAPGIQVSMDGRRETVYSEELVDAHLRLYRNEPGATELVERLQPDLIWLPRHLAVIKTLEKERWTPVFSGPVSVVLARGANPALPPLAAASGMRCFPDY